MVDSYRMEAVENDKTGGFKRYLRYSTDKMDRRRREMFESDFWVSGLNMGVTIYRAS